MENHHAAGLQEGHEELRLDDEGVQALAQVGQLLAHRVVRGHRLLVGHRPVLQLLRLLPHVCNETQEIGSISSLNFFPTLISFQRRLDSDERIVIFQ